MADDAAWNQGWSQGSDIAQRQVAHKQADADEEHKLKINDLISQREALVNKIPTLEKGTPEYEQAHTALQGVIGGIQDFYHPEKNPGAIEKLGHVLTDHLKITNPQDRLQKEQTQRQGRIEGVSQAADSAVAAAPLTTTQKIQAQLREIDASNLDDDGKRRAREKVFGVTSVVKPNWQQFKLADGTIRSYDLNNPDSNIPEGASEVPKGGVTTAKENIAGYEEAVKKGYKGSFAQYMSEERRKGAPLASMKYYNDYAVSHGFKGGWDDIPPEYRKIVDDYAIRKQALDKAYPVSTTVTSKALDAEGQFRTITVTNYKTPQGTETLKDPLWFLAPIVPGPNDGVSGKSNGIENPSPASPTNTDTAPTAPNSNTPPTSRDLKKEAAARNPKQSSAKSSNQSSTNNGSVGAGNAKVSGPLFPGQSKEYNDAKATYDSAVLRQKQMHRFLTDAEKTGNQQAMLGLLFNHIGMTQGAQKGARINQKSVDEAKASAPWIDSMVAKMFHQDQSGDYIYDGYKGGVTLTDEQMKQMVELADEGVVAFKDNVDRIHDRLYQNIPNNSQPSAGNGNTAPDASKAKGTVSLSQAMTLPKYKGKTKEEVKNAITKAGYLPIE